jgi:hypothetical protein
MNLVSRTSLFQFQQRYTNNVIQTLKSKLIRNYSDSIASNPLVCEELVVNGKPLEWREIMGAANEFKEGDGIVGLAASSEEIRQKARKWMSTKTVQVCFNKYIISRNWFCVLLFRYFLIYHRKYKKILLV